MVQASQFRNGGYMVDFYGAGYQVAERMGLAARLQELRYPVTGLTYVNHDGRQTSRFTLPPTFREVVSLLRSDLARTIADQVRAPIQYGTTIEAVHQDGDEVALTLADGTQRTADLLVGADGAHSRVRALAFGAEHRYVRYLRHHVAACNLADRDLSAKIAQHHVSIAGSKALFRGRPFSRFRVDEPSHNPENWPVIVRAAP
ncbi:FAD-dependent monooxygenase [Nonomuraea sp. NPDC049028]|uniref:FAD-dependent monooxygenase n=1 Tax=Nonomuraea sp. NPDC049028 TaxID=3364348 RepID=UPI00371D8948